MTNSSNTQAVDTAYSASKRDMRRILASSLIGTALEYYDFILYATAAGIVFNRIFFTNLDPTAALVLSFATLAAGYVARPLGGVIFGHLGDKVGRKTVLMATIVVMGVTSTLIGLLPATDQIGIWAPASPCHAARRAGHSRGRRVGRGHPRRVRECEEAFARLRLGLLLHGCADGHAGGNAHPGRHGDDAG